MINYKEENYKIDLLNLLAGNTLSPKLRECITEILKAIDQHDLNLAYELSAVKSFIATKAQPTEKYHFTETNEIGPKSAYWILDNLHHNLAFTIGKIPSGAMIISSQGIQQKQKAKITHPLIELMNQEYVAIQKEVSESWSKWRKEQEQKNFVSTV
jgi:hypothetical protein